MRRQWLCNVRCVEHASKVHLQWRKKWRFNGVIKTSSFSFFIAATAFPTCCFLPEMLTIIKKLVDAEIMNTSIKQSSSLSVVVPVLFLRSFICRLLILPPTIHPEKRKEMNRRFVRRITYNALAQIAKQFSSERRQRRRLWKLFLEESHSSRSKLILKRK